MAISRKRRRALITKQRAQDWITSAINPLLRAFERELAVLPAGPWPWHPNGRRLETFYPTAVYVSPYEDNLVDFVEKQPRFEKAIRDRDEARDELEAATAAVFDCLSGVKGEQLRSRVKALAPSADADDIKYLTSWIASHFQSLPSRYSFASVFNDNPDLLQVARAIASDEFKVAERAAAHLEQVEQKLYADLKDERRRLADEYGARILPVIDGMGALHP